ncbi:transcriptional regulator with XRE-family HTH domain [Catenulispora sp. GAS73]|uniref:helix-turn-helix domain-containing protein n=1 Tax=Catenulispora sp. GAS73 TaxID=3156269 RepID=UPI003514138E
MPRWKPLRDGLDPLVVRLVVELRKMKDDSDLSLSQLATKTSRSASSWERYLDGRALPPYEAVESLAGLAGLGVADRASIAALYRAATQVWRRTTAAHDGRPPDAPPQAVGSTWALAAELRALRVRTGSSVVKVKLAEATRYSKSSWGRWLNGEALPPWRAVRALCELAGEPEVALRAVWELADAEWSRRGVVAAQAPLFATVAAPDAPPECAVRPQTTTPARSRPIGVIGLAFVIGMMLGGTVLSVLLTYSPVR